MCSCIYTLNCHKSKLWSTLRPPARRGNKQHCISRLLVSAWSRWICVLIARPRTLEQLRSRQILLAKQRLLKLTHVPYLSRFLSDTRNKHAFNWSVLVIKIHMCFIFRYRSSYSTNMLHKWAYCLAKCSDWAFIWPQYTL